MGKQAHPRALKENEARAVVRALRISPRKLNLVAGLIRGKTAQEALAELAFSHRRIAGPVRKALQAAIANAENNHQLDVDRLVVAEAHVGKSIRMRRFHARGRGRAAPVVKSFSHFTVVVREQAETASKESA
jgi:large subunit ribosomal protein L22